MPKCVVFLLNAVMTSGCYHYVPVSADSVQTVTLREASSEANPSIRVTFVSGETVKYTRPILRSDSLFDAHEPLVCYPKCGDFLRKGRPLTDIAGVKIRKKDPNATIGAYAAVGLFLFLIRGHLVPCCA